MGRYTMSPADAAWLNMDRSTNLMVITSVLWFDRPMDWQKFTEVFDERVVQPFPRFRQRVVEPRVRLGALSPVHWEDVPNLDLTTQMHWIRLPEPGDTATLQRFASGLITRPLDRTRPLWEHFLIDGYGEGSALVSRIHHAIGDGVSLIRVLGDLMDEEPEAGFLPPDQRDTGRRGHLSWIGGSLSAANSVASAGWSLLHEGSRLLAHPARVVDLAQVARGDATAVAKAVLTGRDDPVLKGPLGTAKSVTWCDPIRLDAVKAIGQATGSTVNDVLLAAVSGALHRYLQARDRAPHDIRAIVPVNLRPLDQPLPRNLGNRFGLVFVSLPVGVDGTLRRLEEVKRRMSAIKSTPEAMLSYGILNVIGLTPVQVERVIVDVFTARGSLVLTNVPGPTQTVYIAGAPLRGLMSWVPSSGEVGIGVAIQSYAGEVVIGLAADDMLMPGSDQVPAALRFELETLTAETVPAPPKRRRSPRRRTKVGESGPPSATG